MAKQTIPVPDIGGAENVDVIEVCVAPGDVVSAEDSLIVLESDKASMDIPSPVAGKIVKLLIKEGDAVSEGDNILEIETDAQEETQGEKTSEPVQTEPVPEPEKVVADATEQKPSGQANDVGEQQVTVPDIGGSENVDVIEVCVAVGDDVNEGDSLIVLESDKASMEIPSPASGKVISISVNDGDKVSMGDAILVLSGGAIESAAIVDAPVPSVDEAVAPETVKGAARVYKTSSERHPQEIASSAADIYAGPSVRQLARQLGVDLARVKASGPRGRIVKTDVRNFVKSVLTRSPEVAAVSSGSGIPPIPEVDFSLFGEIDLIKMSKIQKLTAVNMSRNWLNVPHVTQFDDVDISDLEDFRNSMKAEAEKTGVKLTPLPFLLMACAAALKAQPKFNVSLHSDGEHLVQKNYVHIGVAVATPNGLMVPVIRDVDKKGLYQLAAESVELATKARDGKLMPRDMQGGCFTISSLGPIGGTGFTPIVNAPEVAILGVSKASIKPVWNGSEFEPRQMLPLSLSYDHRAINGADAGSFFTFLGRVLADVRRLLL